MKLRPTARPKARRFIDSMSHHQTPPMNRARRVREVYLELRRELGDRAPLRELLECAASLVELFDEEESDPQFELWTGGVPFDCWALDLALADGGWRVMGRERSRRDAMLQDEAEELLMHNGMARWAREMAA